jgi:uncharacterized protein YjeT (DUF2065 family)
MKQPPSETRDDADTESDATGPRLVGLLLVAAGLAHLVAPTALLNLAKQSYSAVLDVDFDPRAGASTRVRALGVGLVAAGAHLLYYGGVVPSED